MAYCRGVEFTLILFEERDVLLCIPYMVLSCSKHIPEYKTCILVLYI